MKPKTSYVIELEFDSNEERIRAVKFIVDLRLKEELKFTMATRNYPPEPKYWP